MKVKGAKQVHYDAGPNMTPLVDVVMVILIFLMLAGKFGDKDHFLASSSPIRSTGHADPKDPVPKDVEFHISVDTINDRFTAHVDGVDDAISDAPKLTQVLTDKLNQYLQIGKQPDDIQVLISPGRQVKYSFLVQVYESALAAQVGEKPNDKHFTKVAFEREH
jgi:biopolymer transport protein ExbD